MSPNRPSPNRPSSEQPGTPDTERGIVQLAWGPVLALVAAVSLVHLLVATRYGWHRDEFYYVTSGRHLAWGYVDQPPLTPLLARAAASLSDRVLPLRLVVLCVQSATLVVAALVARELGGRRFAQVLTAGCIGGGAIFVGASLFLGTTPTDQLAWALIIWTVLRALRLRTTGAWIAVGVVVGVGLENKHTVAVLLIGLVIGLVVWRREVFGTRGPWIAGAIGLALWAPNLWWDARHHWITLDMARVLADKQGGVGGSLAQLPLLLLIFPGPLIVFLWMRGARWARPRGEGREFAWLLLASVVIVVVFTALGGKPYYSAPMLVPLFALGAVATERRYQTGTTGRRQVGAFVATSMIVAPLLALPFFSPAVASALRPLDKEPMETYGWPDIVGQVGRAVAAHPGVVAIYAGNYGEAGALAKYGKRDGISVEIVAGQNAYRDWGPPAGTPTNVIAVGEFDREFLERSWADVVMIRKLSLPGGVENEETANDAAIYLCRRPKGTWSELWNELSYLS